VQVDLHPEARVELHSGAIWYEERRDGLGDEFVAAIDSTIQRIANAPKSFPRWIGTEKAAAVIRTALVERFPYAVAFEDHEHYAVVLAVAHRKRRPLYWLERAGQQSE
jgi:hypothetical protein